MTCQVQNCNSRAIPGEPYCSRCKEEINGEPVSIKEVLADLFGLVLLAIVGFMWGWI